MSKLRPIRFVELDSGVVHEEQVYGGFWIKALYGTGVGRAISKLIAAPPFSRFYGWLQDRPKSKRKVQPFIEKFGINMADFQPEDGRTKDDPYSTFNQFFTRRVSHGARPFAQDELFPAPCDARYFAYETLDESVSIPVKGSFFKAQALLNHPTWNGVFDQGPGFIARLCPVDYHRFHFPDAGRVLDTWRIPGAFHSVNPWALACRQDIFMINERQVTILDTERFGKIAYVEVGATCVGKIKQTHHGEAFERGDEKGMFLFGGSTVIVLGEPGKWSVDDRILEHTREGTEVYLKMGQALGRAR
ncbi:MAG: phosphatidylserine decarboxylase [Myxococcota bacterium]|nr:phosphatidylserine decarboxylase [Myxococcota bacterium]